VENPKEAVAQGARPPELCSASIDMAPMVVGALVVVNGADALLPLRLGNAKDARVGFCVGRHHRRHFRFGSLPS
jgi:hypothetical protein